MKRILVIQIILIFFFSCSARPSQIQSINSDRPETGIYLKAIYHNSQAGLLFSGMEMRVDKNPVKEFRYAILEFLELKPGKHEFNLRMNYGTASGSGIVTGCFELKPGQQLFFKYAAPLLTTSPGQLEIEDLQTREIVPFSCP
ncbi:hypothetical protein EHQ12_11300 [Leptospira gomenensis]|uniref:DUF2846 domain-containing protein n=1 Tax=Leptospira gomenensis TaxID=2484974 RepID=A0A5F1YKD5_9LEPT|nr:hypothetical protein [Leptospira gomenensis]TGK33345.1 hypothetical protein EHQ17_11170 [Leptospira gomenensis]TGK37360.1 hypothetical protein EHQ12_11300 [Leptospira gomenensis]TGK40549.1 hypothetical protein EHQ07_18345 [Leptospira gomenensis]TGK56471.1 hypothetical protein EHQ13_14910 [Leptospira gomenensis]